MIDARQILRGDSGQGVPEIEVTASLVELMTTPRELRAETLDRLPPSERTALCAVLLIGVKHLALDINGVITAAPKFSLFLRSGASSEPTL